MATWAQTVLTLLAIILSGVYTAGALDNRIDHLEVKNVEKLAKLGKIEALLTENTIGVRLLEREIQELERRVDKLEERSYLLTPYLLTY